MLQNASSQSFTKSRNLLQLSWEPCTADKQYNYYYYSAAENHFNPAWALHNTGLLIATLERVLKIIQNAQIS